MPTNTVKSAYTNSISAHNISWNNMKIQQQQNDANNFLKRTDQLTLHTFTKHINICVTTYVIYVYICNGVLI